MKILEKDPEKLLEIKGITKKKLMEILEGYQSSETLRQLMVALSPLGMTPRKVAQIQEHFGNAAPLIVQDTRFAYVKSRVWLFDRGSHCSKSKEF